MNEPSPYSPSILLLGASRGLGYAMAEEFVKRGWSVVGTVRIGPRTKLHDFGDEHRDQVAVETVDINEPHQVLGLRDRLSSRRFEILFVNAGTANHNQAETIAETSREEFVRVMITNALSPMRAVEALQGLVLEASLIGIMSSGQGSVANNEKGGHEVYRGSKAALNTYMRSYAARQVQHGRALLLPDPGWIRTELGGPDAPFTLEEAIPEIVDTVIGAQGTPGLRYLDRKGKTVAW